MRTDSSVSPIILVIMKRMRLVVLPELLRYSSLFLFFNVCLYCFSLFFKIMGGKWMGDR